MLLTLLLLACSAVFKTAHQNYVIDDHNQLQASLNVEFKYTHREKRLSDTSNIEEVTAGPPELPSDSSGSSDTNTTITTSSDPHPTNKSSSDESTPSTEGSDDVNEYCKAMNYPNCTVDDHKYYRAVYVNDSSLWIELAPGENQTYNSTKHMNLSDSVPKRGFMTTAHLSLSNFLFYGIPVKNITILTGGFLHVGPLLSLQIVSKAQYIAPFMGNFNPSASNSSNVYFYSDEEKFIVQWDKMQIENHSEMGNFTFQVQIYNNNDIIFAYKEIPVVELSAENHENAIGVSDAFSIISPNHLVIHVYNELKLNKTLLGNNTAVKLVHMRLCPMIDDCYNCTTEVLEDFECRWCSKAQKCSDRFGDSDYQDWHTNSCILDYKSQGQRCEEYCYFPTDNTDNTTYTPAPDLNQPIIPADSTGQSRVKITCDDNYSVSAHYPLSGGDWFNCTSGGRELPACRKSCNYTKSPINGDLVGALPGHLLKPDSSFPVSCHLGHRRKNKDNKNVTCIDDGVLEPDPANIRCEKYCMISHPHNAIYQPAPTDGAFLHEAETITMYCDANFAFDDFLRGKTNDTTLTLTCDEGSNFSDLDKKCVGYCKVLQHPNTTYTPLIAMLDQTIEIGCANGTFLSESDKGKKHVCLKSGQLLLPTCQYHIEEKSPSKSATSHSLTILLVIFVLTIVCIVGGWVLYAYRNPTSPSGLFLIERCRPWTWRSHTYSRHQESLGESYYMDGSI